MAIPAWPHAGHFIRALQNSSTGALYVNTNYTVFQSDGSTQATIYTDRTKATTRTQPLTTDASGNAEFYTDPAAGLVLSLSGVGTKVIDVLPDVSDLLGSNFVSDGGATVSPYLLSGSDNLRDLGFLAGSTSNLTIQIPNTLPQNFSCNILHEGFAVTPGVITFVALSGATIHSFGVTSTSSITHPGPGAWVNLMCRANGTGTAADIIIGNGHS